MGARHAQEIKDRWKKNLALPTKKNRYIIIKNLKLLIIIIIILQ